MRSWRRAPKRPRRSLDAARARAVASDLVARNALLELQSAQMRRALYGQHAERGRLIVDQLELGYEEWEARASEDEALGADVAARTTVAAFTRARPSRKPLPAHLPRERVVVPAPATCPCCGSDRLSKLGEDVTETLEVIPRRWKVIQTVRERFACRACEAVTQPRRRPTPRRASCSGQPARHDPVREVRDAPTAQLAGHRGRLSDPAPPAMLV